MSLGLGDAPVVGEPPRPDGDADSRLRPPGSRWRSTLTAMAGRFLDVEVLSFLLVGGLGYAVDVGAFNVLWGTAPFDAWDPSVAKVVAVALAMVVTYLGNKLLTWRGASSSTRQILLFVVFNVIGLGFSILTLWISHDLLHLTSRLDDNLSANVLGLAMGTVFRYWSYRHFVFETG